MKLLAALFLALISLGACAPVVVPAGPHVREAGIEPFVAPPLPWRQVQHLPLQFEMVAGDGAAPELRAGRCHHLHAKVPEIESVLVHAVHPGWYRYRAARRGGQAAGALTGTPREG